MQLRHVAPLGHKPLSHQPTDKRWQHQKAVIIGPTHTRVRIRRFVTSNKQSRWVHRLFPRSTLGKNTNGPGPLPAHKHSMTPANQQAGIRPQTHPCTPSTCLLLYNLGTTTVKTFRWLPKSAHLLPPHSSLSGPTVDTMQDSPTQHSWDPSL